jgi:hypothetical protein
MSRLTATLFLLAVLVGCEKQAPGTSNKGDISGFDSKEKTRGPDKEAAASQPGHRNDGPGNQGSSRDLGAKPGPQKQEPEAGQKKPAAEEDLVVTVANWHVPWQTYKYNAARGDSEYGGKRIRIDPIAHKVEKTPDGYALVCSVWNPPDDQGYRFLFPKDQAKTLADLPLGQSVLIEAKCKEWDSRYLRLILTDCKLVKK